MTDKESRDQEKSAAPTTSDPRWRLTTSARRLVRLLALNAPNTVLAMEAFTVFRRSLALGGTDPARWLAGWLVEHARMGSGLCSDPECGNEIPAQSTFTPRCAACQAKIEADADLLEGDSNEDEVEPRR